MNYEMIIQNLGIFSIGTISISGLLYFLIKSLVKHSLNKDFEVFKIKIQKTSEIEKLQYSILQEKRASVISELYALLATFENSVWDLMAIFQPTGTPSEEEKAKVASKNGTNFIEYYLTHKIYFDKDTCKLIDAINEKFKRAWIDFKYKDKIIKEKPEEDLRMNSWKTVTKEIPLIKEKIEDVFREILGIK